MMGLSMALRICRLNSEAGPQSLRIRTGVEHEMRTSSSSSSYSSWTTCQSSGSQCGAGSMQQPHGMRPIQAVRGKLSLGWQRKSVLVAHFRNDRSPTPLSPDSGLRSKHGRPSSSCAALLAGVRQPQDALRVQVPTSFNRKLERHQ